MRIAFSALALIMLVLSAFTAGAWAQSDKTAGGKVERGRYLADEVAMCGDCHSPLNGQGQVDRTRWLQGAPLRIQPVQADPNWAVRAPNIAGLPGWSEADAIRFFETNLTPNGLSPRPPMHRYKLPRADAEAIVSYLKSLKPANK
jgi:mono/diheme cytochrome c family protein